MQQIKKYGWPLLAIILIILFLLCGWVHGNTSSSTNQPAGGGDSTSTPDDVPEDVPEGWVLCYTYQVDDTYLHPGAFDQRDIIPTPCDDGNLKITVERWFECAGTSCNGSVNWQLYDSSYFNIRFSRSDTTTVNTFSEYGGTPDEVADVSWDGVVAWRFKVTNGCDSQICFSYRVKVYHWVGSETQPAPSGAEPTPGFEMIVLFASVVCAAFIINLKRNKYAKS